MDKEKEVKKINQEKEKPNPKIKEDLDDFIFKDEPFKEHSDR